MVCYAEMNKAFKHKGPPPYSWLHGELALTGMLQRKMVLTSELTCLVGKLSQIEKFKEPNEFQPLQRQMADGAHALAKL